MRIYGSPKYENNAFKADVAKPDGVKDLYSYSTMGKNLEELGKQINFLSNQVKDLAHGAAVVDAYQTNRLLIWEDDFNGMSLDKNNWNYFKRGMALETINWNLTPICLTM